MGVLIEAEVGEEQLGAADADLTPSVEDMPGISIEDKQSLFSSVVHATSAWIPSETLPTVSF